MADINSEVLALRGCCRVYGLRRASLAFTAVIPAHVICFAYLTEFLRWCSAEDSPLVSTRSLRFYDRLDFML